MKSRDDAVARRRHALCNFSRVPLAIPRLTGLFSLLTIAAACSGERAAEPMPAEAPPGAASAAPAPPSGTASAAPAATTPPPSAPAPRAAGTILVLTYNVAGLPEALSHSHPAANTPLMSPLLNDFDLVLVQEDFAYHDALVAKATHPYKTQPFKGTPTTFGDGLNLLSRAVQSGASRTAWKDCSGTFGAGNDCLTEKGFLKVTLELATGVSVDVYDVHLDAGRDKSDRKTRDKQIAQLLTAIASATPARAVIVAGDTNLKDDGDEPSLQALLTGGGFTDACRAVGCVEPKRLDRVLMKSGGGVALGVKNWRIDPRFQTPAGEPLSDHDPVAVDVTWAAP